MSSTDRIDYHERLPTPVEYAEFREHAGWSAKPADACERSLAASLYSVVATRAKGGQLVGIARVIGDGAIYFYVQDVIVHPDHQRSGIGSGLMDCVMAWLGRNTNGNAFVGLMAAAGVAPFYGRYGFEARAQDAPGMFRAM